MRRGSALTLVPVVVAFFVLTCCASAAEDLVGIVGLLRSRVAENGKAGMRGRVRLKMAGGPVEALVLGAGDGAAKIEIQGTKLDLAWRSVEDEERFEIFRGFVKEDDAEGAFALAVLAHTLAMPEVASKYEDQALTADARLRDRVGQLALQFPPPPEPQRVNVQRANEAPAKATQGDVGSATVIPPLGREPGGVGARGAIGAPEGAKVLDRLVIASPGVYENIIVDGGFKPHSLVQIKCDGVTLRNCTIRNGARNGVEVYGKDVTIERCEIHHMLSGTFKDQDDAHGITGRPTALTVRDCDIHQVSGDCLQFDPDRGPWSDVLIEHCTLWTAPLSADTAGFKKGERPGENALDTKQQPRNPRSKVAVRYCYVYGFGDGQIANQAALNIKDHVEATIEGCVFAQNDICLRVRGVGRYGGSVAHVRDCACYSSKAGFRIEDGIQDLKLLGMAYAPDVKQKLAYAGGGAGKGFENIGERPAPALADALKTWGARP
ncbi:MAG: right-handed parallel beta-helix repeat-containing protein [Planctomycetes bacterium]|nr:right-handed parallel beta-helix repeat-containing protein [Planctomycetota bacterium]